MFNVNVITESEGKEKSGKLVFKVYKSTLAVLKFRKIQTTLNGPILQMKVTEFAKKKWGL